jgi:hypothetical protein
VALSLAGLFDDVGMPDPSAAPLAAAEGTGPKKPRSSPEPWSYDEPEQDAAPVDARRGSRRALLSPGGLLGLAAVMAALFIIGYFVSKADPPKPPSDQVTTVAQP